MPSEPPEPSRLAAAIEGLVADCRHLRGTLAELAEVPDDELEDACARHLAETRSLGARISQAAAALQRSRAQDALPAHLQGRLDEAAGEPVRLLGSCAELYARLARRTRSALEEVECQMGEVRRGGRALRSYARGARTQA